MEGYQVIRMFLMIVEMRKGMKANPAYLEIGSYWIDPKGKTTVVGLQRTLGHYIDTQRHCIFQNMQCVYDLGILLSFMAVCTFKQPTHFTERTVRIIHMMSYR